MKEEFHVISTGRQPVQKVVEIVAKIHPYVDAIHIREKTKTAKELAQMVSALLLQGVPPEKLVINDRVDVAAVFEVRGVQLAHHSLNVRLVKKRFPGLCVGCSVHSLEEAMAAEREGADYLTYGHVFATASKPGVLPRGVKELESVVKQVDIPVIAIGGVKPENVELILQAGAKGIAVMSGVFFAVDPVAEAKAYEGILRNWGSKHGEPE